MSEIEYTVDEEDVLSFNEFHSENSPTARRALNRYCVWLPIAFVGAAILSWWLDHP